MNIIKKNERPDKPGMSGRALPRHSIRGPIDPTKSPSIPNHVLSSLSPPGSFNHPRSRASSPASSFNMRSDSPSCLQPSKSHTLNDFSSLLNPDIYQTLSTLEIPPPFKSIASQLGNSDSPSDLICAGHFREAAIKAVQLLTTSKQILSTQEIFDLVYQRLSCLTLCNQTTVAVQEAKALEDLNSAQYYDKISGQHLAPWELRVLAVRLQGIGFGDVRRGVVGYYDLVSDARSNLTKLKQKRKSLNTSDVDYNPTQSEINKWEKRLSDLGLYIASALIEMEDFEGASRFLSTLPLSPLNPNLYHQKALLWLFLGDVQAARECAREDKVLITLAHMADAQFEKAVLGWENLVETGKTGEIAMWKQNLAISLIYMGRIEEARKILERLTDEGYGFHALSFNLSTVYELCTERSRSLKIGLAEKLAEILESSEAQGPEKIKIGWDKVNKDFKL